MPTPTQYGLRNVAASIANRNQGNADKNISLGSPQIVSPYIEPRLTCELHNGIPVVRGRKSGYYVFNQDGQRLLVLNRKQHESILIDHAIDIQVLEINDNEVKLGVICPDDTIVH